MNSRRVLGNHSLASQPHTLTRIFADQADATPDALAIDTGTQTITYARLSQRYQEIADELRTVAGRGDRVGIAIADPIEYYAALLATMSIGAAYVPVSADSVHGQGRQDANLSDAELSADHAAHDSANSRDSIARRSAAGENRSRAGNNGRHQAQACGGTVPYSALTSRPHAIPRSPEPASGYSLAEVSTGLRLTAAVTDGGVQSLRPATRQAHKPSPSNAAAVFFGRRSLVLPHRCATAGISAETHLFVPDDPLGGGDRIGQIASHTGPRSVEEMWLAWSTGACLVPYTNDAAHGSAPTTIDRWIADRSISVISTTPSDVLSWHTDPTALRLLILGGEPCPADITRVMAGREVWNTYRTEATGVTSAAKITPETRCWARPLLRPHPRCGDLRARLPIRLESRVQDRRPRHRRRGRASFRAAYRRAGAYQRAPRGSHPCRRCSPRPSGCRRHHGGDHDVDARAEAAGLRPE